MLWPTSPQLASGAPRSAGLSTTHPAWTEVFPLFHDPSGKSPAHTRARPSAPRKGIVRTDESLEPINDTLGWRLQRRIDQRHRLVWSQRLLPGRQACRGRRALGPKCADISIDRARVAPVDLIDIHPGHGRGVFPLAQHRHPVVFRHRVRNEPQVRRVGRPPGTEVSRLASRQPIGFRHRAFAFAIPSRWRSLVTNSGTSAHGIAA